MTKKEIVREIAERADIPQVKTKDIVQWTFDAIIEALIREGRIELRNFGVFEVKRRKARKARNPKTDEPVLVEAKNVVTFQPGKVMEDMIRRHAKVAEPKPKTRRPKTDTKKPPTPVGATTLNGAEAEEIPSSEE